ncbi:hypothetical protein LX69_00814 [Breznakibacter xylanolyticus]|uniref:Outer membrane protein with beta-barrel domain n=1 Tax=Breznakibacter xylanolyticus TaxID=990 RepID=A0A2W7NM11_9BACT|nr:hypothetical protein [Breznakibacter xylanolyticus]PZX19147.1 hypothetical protein LX69_00814 [Breznakibacter xylanolyticus]
MKRLSLAILALISISFATQAQDDTQQEMRTIFGSPNISSIGGYGALNVGYTKINKLDAVQIGGRGMVVLNHSLALGLGGNGVISRPVYDVNLKEDFEFAGGYGGFIIEPILGSMQPIHVSFPILIGGGGIGYLKHWGDYEDDHNYENYDEDSYAFFVFEPGVELEFNVVKFMRFAINGSYRLTSDIDLNYKKTRDASFADTDIAPGNLLNGFNVGITMKFGKF